MLKTEIQKYAVITSTFAKKVTYANELCVAITHKALLEKLHVIINFS
jgi:hypothetical protein